MAGDGRARRTGVAGNNRFAFRPRPELDMGNPLTILRQHRHHPRHWRENVYVYPVISRRSGGLSIGINLNPDAACNFDCIYCQVDRTQAPQIRDVDPDRLGEELEDLVAIVEDGSFWGDEAFADVPAVHRGIRDFAFSGDGEPTTCRIFAECVRRVAAIKRKAGLRDTRIVLITDACYLTRPEVVAGLAIMDQNNGDIWAKLDAGTEEYYRLVNRPNFPLQHVVNEITAAGRVRPLVIQSLFMRVHGRPPELAEMEAFADRLNDILAGGGRIDHVQVYTVARLPAESFVDPLNGDEVDTVADLVRKRTGLPAKAYHGSA
jgi:wyosine [tRNA(Phe)-imidazoG37] synthetase (radical SAM superfamily)